MPIIRRAGDQPQVNHQALRLWVEGLESDRFKQGSGRLGYREIIDLDIENDVQQLGPLKNCCLGVFCEIAIDQGVAVKRTTRIPSTKEMEIVEYGGNSDFLPPSVQDWLGIIDGNPKFKVLDPELETSGAKEEVWRLISASELNDGENQAGRQYSFGEIAAAIRRTYPEAFQ